MLILPDWLITSARERPRSGWGLRISGGWIVDIGTHDALVNKYPADPRIEASGQVLCPGFVNVHTHLYGVLAHGIPLDKAPSGFWPFLTDFWWPMVEDRIDRPMLRAAAEWQCLLMLRSGITSFYDCLEAPHSLPGCLNSEAAVVGRHGQRAILSFEATQRVSEANGQLGLRENYSFTEKCLRTGGLVQGMMCYHTTFTCSSEFIRQAFFMASELGCQVHAHLSEGTYEPAYTQEKYGLRPVQYYDSLGVLGKDMLASQCVQLDPTEIALLAEKGVSVVHMPLSNCEVGGGIAPVPQMAAAGVTLGLGSDSYIDNFFEVMRSAFLIHKANQLDPRLMPAGQVLVMATEGGARALHLTRVGRLEVGWKADLLLIDGAFPTPATPENLYDQLILYRNPQDVRLVMVEGKVLLSEGKPLTGNPDQARQALHREAARLWQAAS